jgi:very-short-patch-repair endonuclease/endogenous inhibitor of DNA gyrase (YacG/DUF329 family)
MARSQFIPCECCGKEVRRKPSELKRGRRVFCSRSCAAKTIHTGLPKPKSAESARLATAIRVASGFVPWNKKPWVVLTCEICGKSYERVPAAVKRSRFCGVECRRAYIRSLAGGRHPLDRRVEKACEFCAKVVRVKPAKLAEFRFCSRRCQGSHQSRVQSRVSAIELRVLKAIDSVIPAFEGQYRIGPYVVDMALPAARLVVEVDGDYWHGNEAQQRKDQRKTTYLEGQGWTVLRIWEHDIRNSMTICVERIVTHVPIPLRDHWSVRVVQQLPLFE